MTYIKTALVLSTLFIVGCASTVPNNVFLPVETSKTIPFFRNGIPIAAGFTDSTFILTTIEPSDGYPGGSRAIRLWLLYKNYSHTPYLLKPLEHVTLTCEDLGKGTKTTISPMSPTIISAAIENEKRTIQTLQIISGTLKNIAAQPTTVNDNYGNSWQVNNLEEKKERILANTIDNTSNTAYWYEIYKRSTYSGIFKKNTIFFNESVNGLIFFPISPSLYGDMINVTEKKRTRYKYTVTIQTPDGMKSTTFTAIPGE
jgi:hypothetical protein